MNWRFLRAVPWLDTRARFVAHLPPGGRLLDLGSSDGETLGHFAELRPDLRFVAVDLAGQPERYPPGTQYHRCDLERECLPLPDGSADGITCMHLVEHLRQLPHVFGEVARLLRPGARLYVETPRPRTAILDSAPGVAAGTFTLNFYDDLTHVRPVPGGDLAARSRAAGLQVVASGLSRNWLFAAAWPLWRLRPPSRQKWTARAHWLGWSSYLIAQRPLTDRPPA